MRKYSRHRGIPFYMCIMAIVIGTVMLMECLNFIYLSRKSTVLAVKYAAESFESTSGFAKSDIKNKIDPIIALSETAALLAPEYKGRIQWEEAKRLFLSSSLIALSTLDNILAVNYGFSNGDFFSLTALDDPAVRSAYDAPEEAAYAVWSVAFDTNGKAYEWWLFLDKDTKEISSRKYEQRYDPRTRAWYRDAMKSGSFIMTEPYIFKTSKELGVAVAVPLKSGAGVFSINVTLKGLDDLLDSISLSDKGSIFLLDENKRILGERSPFEDSVQGRRLSPFGNHPMGNMNEIFDKLSDCRLSDNLETITIDSGSFFLSCDEIPMGVRNMSLIMLSPVEDFNAVVGTFLKNSILFAGLTMLVFIPIAALLSFRIGKSLQMLLKETATTRRMTNDDELHSISPIAEIRRLANAFLTMKKRIRRHNEDLHTVQNKLEETVRQRTGELRTALRSAEEATQAKSKFLSTMSHEIRTPMNAIIGFTYLFNKSNLTEKQVDYLEKIRISSETLLHIINDVLDFSKIEAGRFEIEHIPFQLTTVLDTVYSITKFSVSEKHLNFTVDHDDDVPTFLMGDPTRLHQILLNLISNAVKFTSQGGIDVGVRKAAEQPDSMTDGTPDVRLIFSVKDSGIGMSEEQVLKLFTPFTQADNTISRKYGGTGLGLAICKQLAELMDGHIGVSSVAGVGTTFEATIKFSLAPSEAVLVEDKDHSQAITWRKDALILVVDDNAINRDIAGALLENHDLKVEFAENGKIALNMIFEKKYDLIFMDMQMPVMDGVAATKAIRRLQYEGGNPMTSAADVPIIAMTANAMAEDKHRCLKAGMNDHIAKPIVPSALTALLVLWLPNIEQ